MIHINNTQITVDDQVVSVTEPYIKYALEDIEGFGIDGGVKFGNTSPVFFFDEGTMTKYELSDAIGRRPIIFAKKDDGSIGSIRIYKQGFFPGQAASEVNDLSEFEHSGFITVLMVAEVVSRGEELVAAAKVLKELGASSVYAYVSHLDTVFLEGGEGTLIDCLENSDLIGELFTADIVYKNWDGGRITVIEL